MTMCKECSSYAINQYAHGRTPGVDLDLCDVCYWRKRVETAVKAERERCAKVCERVAENADNPSVAYKCADSIRKGSAA